MLVMRAPGAQAKEDPVSDLQAIADRVEIQALRGEFTDALLMHHSGRLASLFTRDGTVRLPPAYAGAAGREDMRAGASTCRPCRTIWCRPRTRARSCVTAAPRPAGPACRDSPASAMAGRS